MKPLDFYELGLQIAESATSEAQHRTVVNRVYYGLHHESCCRYFRTELSPSPLNRSRRHTDLRVRFNQPDNPNAGAIGQLLGNLMTLRTEADYQLAPPLRYRSRSYSSEQLMRFAISIGEDLLEALETYSPGEAPDGCRCPQGYSTG